MKRILIALINVLLWIARCRLVPIPLDAYRISKKASEVMAEQDKRSDLNSFGEAKRHYVYAKLIKLYPKDRHKDIALAIELVKHNINA